ncbi:MAG TPA: hypothetical protein VKA32_00635 [Gammaproteobacteria bacterium]|nr:hypothetical protein [Gammaproteobacteria bacterium]
MVQTARTGLDTPGPEGLPAASVNTNNEGRAVDSSNLLSVPKRQPADARTDEYRARAVEDWVQNLPVANLGETSRQVFERLRDANRLELPAAQRLAFLEQLREMVLYVADGLRKHYLGRELPLRDKARRVAGLATVLLQEFALGYEIVVRTGDGRDLGRRGRAQALQRALFVRGRILLENWLVYQSPPPDTWQRVHALYTTALSTGTADQRLKDDSGHYADGRVTPATTYKHIVLLAVAGPLSLPTVEIIDSWRLLAHWADKAEIVDAGDDRSGNAVFRVPRQTDAGPHAAVRELDRDDDRVLLVSTLVSAVERELSRTGQGLAFWRRKPLADVQPALASRLLLALGSVPSRQAARMKARAKVEVVIGLSRIHRVLAREEGQGEDMVEESRQRFEARDTNAGRDDHDVWDLIYPNEMMQAMEQEQRRQGGAHHAVEHDEASAWHLVNLSAGGYCLLSDPSESNRIQVGDLILLREMARRGMPWQVGVMRWMRSLRDRGLQMGIEILAASAVAVQLRSQHADGHFGPVERGLYLPPTSATDLPATLVVPGAHYRTGREVRLRYQRRESTFLLERERETTPQFVQFEFRRADLLASEDPLAALTPTDE